MLDKPILFTKVFVFAFAYFWRQLERAAARSKESWAFRLSGGKAAAAARDANIVIVGANFAGYQAAKVLSLNLPPSSRYRVVVVEPSSHFQFTWVLPRFCVAKGHEHKAFIPYGSYVAGAPEGAVQWIKDRVVSVSKSHVKLQDSGKEIPYEYLLIATGSAVDEGLPSRTNATEKLEGMKRMRAMQKSIEGASRIVVVGGGAAGVEVATDAKAIYPDKTIILVHSRKKCMHRFGEGLQEATEEGFKRLGVDVILEERVVGEDKAAGTVTLRSGRVIECDLFINCTGQRPASDILKALAPETISESGHIKVKPSLQIDNDEFPNIYACGDVADTKTPNPNGRSAHRQGEVAADNILQAVRGKEPSYVFANTWADGIIELTLGLDHTVTHVGDGQQELVWRSKGKGEELMAARCWKNFGAKPYEDDSVPQDGTAAETA